MALPRGENRTVFQPLPWTETEFFFLKPSSQGEVRGSFVFPHGGQTDFSTPLPWGRMSVFTALPSGRMTVFAVPSRGKSVHRSHLLQGRDR